MAASEMCIPYPPPLQTSVGFIFVVFVNFANRRKGTTNDSRLRATQSTKEQRFETK